MTRNGRLIRSVSGFYTVRTDEGDVVCRARGIFRKRGLTPLVGDFVTIEALPDGSGSVIEVAGRKNELIRPPVCNIDALVILASEAPPRADPFVIDKMAAAAAWRHIDVILLINKCDLDPGDGLYEIYKNAGFPAIRGSALTGGGLDALWPLIGGRCVALAGNSGVGKSQLLNTLENIPYERGRGVSAGVRQGQRAVGEVSGRLGRGRHTTRHVELFDLPGGVLAADTPGFAALDTMEKVPDGELASCFLDFRPFLDGCRFSGCLHGEGQAGCAVREAVLAGGIHPARYGNYLRMLTGEAGL